MPGWALHFSLTPTLFEPAETPGVVSPFMVLLTGYGPRVAESGLGLIADYPCSAPYEDVTLKVK